MFPSFENNHLIPFAEAFPGPPRFAGRKILRLAAHQDPLLAHMLKTGILAHESALKGGEIVRLPSWTHRD